MTGQANDGDDGARTDTRARNSFAETHGRTLAAVTGWLQRLDLRRRGDRAKQAKPKPRKSRHAG